jgi:hypothetical protein
MLCSSLSLRNTARRALLALLAVACASLLASVAHAQDATALPFAAPAEQDPTIAEIKQRLAEQDREIRALKAQLNREPDLLETLPATDDDRDNDRVEALPAVLKPGEAPASSE